MIKLVFLKTTQKNTLQDIYSMKRNVKTLTETAMK